MRIALWLSGRFELTRGGGAQNVRPMEGLRGFAVFLVFLVHYVSLVEPMMSTDARVIPLAHAMHTIGNTGVDLFFVLSGFLIYGSLITRTQPFLRFMSRRVQRIYPAFIVVFAAYIVLSLLFPEESRIPDGDTQRAIYLAQNFLLLPGLFPIEPMITVAWSLSYEMFYYLLIPLVIAVLGLRKASKSVRSVLFLIVAGLLATYCAVHGGHVRLIMFIAGILLYEALAGERVPALGALPALLVLIIGLLCTLLPYPGPAGYALKVSILFAAFFLLCFSCFRDSSSWLAGGFSWTPLRWLGNMSYSYYLVHGLALKGAFLVIALLLPDPRFDSLIFWGLLPPMFLVSLVPAALLFLLVERPYSLKVRG